MRNVKKQGWLTFFDYFKRFLLDHCLFDSFCFKRHLASDFIASNYESRVLIDPCQVICLIIIRQGCSLEVFPVEPICIQLWACELA